MTVLEQVLPGIVNAPTLHPMFVHFPIALWASAGLFLLLGMLRRRDDLFTAGRWLLYLGAIGAAVAVATGLWAADALGHESSGHELVHVHRDFMLAASGLGVISAFGAAALRNRQNVAAKWGLTVLTLVTISILTLGADRGAALVFQHGVGVVVEPRQAPDDAHDGEHGASHSHAHGLQ